MSTTETTPAAHVGDGGGDDAMSRARTMAHTAAGEASGMKDELSVQTRRVMGDAREELSTQAREQTDRLATSVRSLATRVQAMADGRTDEAGRLPDMAREAASHAAQWADSLSSRDIDEVLDDLRRQARRKPGMFLLGAGVAGIVVGRLARNMRAAEQHHDARTSGYASYEPAYPSAYGEPQPAARWQNERPGWEPSR